MNTSAPISAISYNTESYLKMVLNRLYDLHIISDYMYILHKAEEDEKKDHFHLWLCPNTRIDTINLQNEFKELDPTKPDKPLGITNPRKSNIDEWILYCQHFRPYLFTKLEDRKYYYQKSDFRFLDSDTFEENYYHAFHSSDWAKQLQINTLLSDPNFCRADLILQGVLPLNQANSLLSLLRLEQTNSGVTDRAGRTDIHD